MRPSDGHAEAILRKLLGPDREGDSLRCCVSGEMKPCCLVYPGRISYFAWDLTPEEADYLRALIAEANTPH